MSHECESCGQWCACDVDDTALDQPDDCIHFRDKLACDQHDDWYGELSDEDVQESLTRA